MNEAELAEYTVAWRPERSLVLLHESADCSTVIGSWKFDDGTAALPDVLELIETHKAAARDKGRPGHG